MELEDEAEPAAESADPAIAESTAPGPFCPHCGRPGSSHSAADCSRVAASPMHPPPLLTSPKPRPRPAWFVAMTALVAALLAIGWQLVSIRSELRELRRDQAAISSADRAQASESSKVAGALSLRIGQLEAKNESRRDPSEIAAEVEKSVFTVEARAGFGSAWVLSSGSGTSRLVTNFHVVEDAWVNGVKAIRLLQDDQTFGARIVQVAEAADLALIEVDTTFPALKVSRSEPPAGSSVLVVGSPLGLGGSVSSGVVSAYRLGDGERFMQFTAPISPGNSGGPVVDEQGQVIGVAVAKFVGSGAEGLGFAIPSARVCDSFSAC